MSSVKAIARRDGEPGVEMLVPIQGNELIFRKLAVRLRQLQDVLRSGRLHSLIALDSHALTDVIRGEHGYAMHVRESYFELSATGHTSLLLTSKDGARLHWPSLTRKDIEAMSSAGEIATYCSWCGINLVQAGGEGACPACRSVQSQTAFNGLSLWELFQLPGGSIWQKITPNDALCVAGGPDGKVGQSSPISQHQEVSVV